jgi:hypothetical protein
MCEVVAGLRFFFSLIIPAIFTRNGLDDVLRLNVRWALGGVSFMRGSQLTLRRKKHIRLRVFLTASVRIC